VLGRYWRTSLFWGLGIAVYTLLMIVSFPTFESSGALDISQYPEGMREAFNLTAMDTIEPYLSSQIFSFLPLIVAFLPVTIFAGAIAGAEERGSLDILFGNPLPRAVFVIGTWLGVAILTLAMFTIVGLLSYATAVVTDVDLSLTDATLSQINVFPIVMVFGGIALLLSARVRQRGTAIGVPVGIMFLMYLADILGKISDTYAPLRNISAFKSYGDALQDGMPWGGFFLLLAIGVGIAALAIPAFDRRDIYA
jgi:ABC-2 type transport system permease protein